MRSYFSRVPAFTVPLCLAAVAGMLWIHGPAKLDDRGRALAAQPQAKKAHKAQTGEKAAKPKKIKRVGSVVGLNEETMEEYIILHEHVWPEVLERLRKSNVRNYSIFVGQLGGDYYLFSYFEHIGDDFEADMANMAADPVTRDWWKLTDPLQHRVEGTPVGDQWKRMKEVFHME